MLRLIETSKDKSEAQQIFAKNLKSDWDLKEDRLIVWRPNSKYLEISHNKSFWVSTDISSDSLRCAYNTFGKYIDGEKGLQITVEINVPIEDNSKRYSGFFAIDDVSNEVYLMHDAAIGGGRKGIGRNQFLSWLGPELEEVSDTKGFIRPAIVVTSIHSKSIGNNLERFVQAVFDFKDGISTGQIKPDEDSANTYADYFKEYSGTKKGIRASTFEYISWHGAIVHALQKQLRKRISEDEDFEGKSIVKNRFIDLGIQNNEKRLIELYEVKTSADRNSIYTAIGQLLVHGYGADLNIKRFLVLPQQRNLSKDIMKTLDALNVAIIRFKLNKKNVTILM